MLLRLTLALAVVVGAAAAMKASQAAEDTPYIGVYEANVTDMEGYKANFLTPLQPKLDADIQERWTGKTTERVGKAPENRVVIGLYPSKAKLDAFWNESKDIFKIGQKYSTGMRFFAAPAMMPLPALANNQTFEIYEAAVSDENGYKNDFLKAIEPKLQKHKIAFLARGFNIGEELSARRRRTASPSASGRARKPNRASGTTLTTTSRWRSRSTLPTCGCTPWKAWRRSNRSEQQPRGGLSGSRPARR